MIRKFINNKVFKAACTAIPLRHLLVFAVILVTTIIFCQDILTHLFSWGGRDWDQFIFWNAVPQSTILDYHQFPLWNPYVNGGNILLAHPHSSFLSPLYIFVLLFGPVVGIKIQIIVYMMLGLWGMLRFARFLGANWAGSWLASFVFMFSSIYSLHVAEGHISWLPLALVPWVFMFYLKSIDRIKFTFHASLFLVLIYLAGNVYVFNILALSLVIYSTLECFQRRSLDPLRRSLAIYLVTFSLCSIKLIPMLEFIFTNYRMTPGHGGIDFKTLGQMLLSTNQANMDIGTRFNFKVIGWHEMGAYVGLLPLLLSLSGCVLFFKKRWPFVVLGIISLFIAMGNESPVNLWAVVHSLPVFSALTVPYRYIWVVVFCISLLSGMGLTYIVKALGNGRGRRSAITIAISSYIFVFFVFLNLYSVNSPILKNGGWMDPLDYQKNSSFAQRYDGPNPLNDAHSRSSIYPTFLSNSGLVEGYEVLKIPRGQIKKISSPEYRGEAYLVNNKGTIEIVRQTPNKIVLEIDAQDGDTIVINQNYHSGWCVAISTDGDHSAHKRGHVEPYDGLISAPIKSGQRRVVFYYLPKSFIIGIFVSLLSIIFCFFKIRKYRSIPND